MKPRKAGERVKLPDDHVHVDDVRISLISNEETGLFGITLEVGTAMAILEASEAMAIRDALLEAARDVYAAGQGTHGRRGHTH